MKTKYWIAILAGLLALSLVLSLPLLSGSPALQARITSQGQLICTLDLSVDQELTVTAPNGGVNTVTVRGRKIAVTAASCPDHYCMDRGFCDSGAPIVCLPNALVISFSGDQTIDGAVG